VERTFFEGRMRLMFGYEMIFIDINHYDGLPVSDAVITPAGEPTTALSGKTRITEDYEALLRGDPNSTWLQRDIRGYHGGRIGLLQTGLMWDTRDLEPDPSDGIFAELAQEFSGRITGSEFNFSKHLIQVMTYKRLLPRLMEKTVLATRMAFGTIRGNNIPFTEVFDQWSASEAGGIEVLGGSRSLRGYREYRFTGMVYGWANAELRTRLAQSRILNQHLGLSLVPFYDVGRVWDRLGDVNLQNFRAAPGIGARIAWNQATIIRLDYARSREDGQFFFVFGHTF
jgi:outer membrane protein assembly factor BamA